MSSDIVRHTGVDSWVDIMGPVGQLAGAIAKTEFVPGPLRNKPDAVAAAILTGRELNLGPMTSLRGIDMIDGRPRLTGELLGARILQAGHRIEWIESTDAKATVRIQRGDGLSEATATWTTRDAERAGLTRKKNWTQYPRDMLAIRALTEAARRACPDVSLGLETANAPDGPQTAATPEGVVSVQLAPTVAPRPPQEPSRPIPAPADPIEDAEVVEDAPSEPEQPELPDPEADRGTDPETAPITGREIRHLHAIVSELGRMQGHPRYGPDERREIICEAAGVRVESMSDLTLAQAGIAIANLAHKRDELRREAESAE